MKLKIKFTSCICAILLIVITACDEGFVELNSKPDSASNLDSKLLLPWIMAGPTSERFTEWRTNFIITSSWVQHFVGGWAYDTYNSDNDQYTGAYMNRIVPAYMADLADVLLKNQNTRMGAMALIMKVQIMHRLADMHGMIPYSEAFQPEIFLTPKYDELETVYNTMFEELRTARQWLREGAGEDPENFDILYGGDLLKWEKFANSLMLRLGLRLSEVDPATSEAIIREAISEGVMDSNDDIAWINYTGNGPVDLINSSGRGLVFNDFGADGHLFAYSEQFVDFIADHNDPREGVLMGTYDVVDNQEVVISLVPGTHRGMQPGSYGVDDDPLLFAQPRRDIMVLNSSPTMLLTYAEVEFNRAEAIQRGWLAGSASEAYESGIRSAMRMLDLYPKPDLDVSEVDAIDHITITEDEINDYLQQDVIRFNEGTAIEQINTQKWVALLFDGYEAFANYRRIGYPELTPVTDEFRDARSDGTIPKRVIYPASEFTTNTANYNRAIEIQGPDEINTRLWWDVN